MSNFAEYITPEKAFEIQIGDTYTLDDYRSMAADKNRCQCGESVWRFAGQNLCFSCTTGEADASEDYELIYIPRKRASKKRSY